MKEDEVVDLRYMKKKKNYIFFFMCQFLAIFFILPNDNRVKIVEELAARCSSQEEQLRKVSHVRKGTLQVQVTRRDSQSSS